jgi:serine/threonine protein kinase
VKFICPFCRTILGVGTEDIGINVQCGKCGEITRSPQSAVAANVVLGSDFIILEELGRGGMGIVYFAHQISLDRPAALKVLSNKYSSNNEFIAGFIKEARSAAKLNHPNIVQAYAVGEDSSIYYFAMEYIEGETMKDVLKRHGKIPIDNAVEVIRQIADALDFAWKEQRLIHRDIKPDNIMIVAKNNRAKLADLGLARIAGEVDDSNEDEVMGTPQYISPEHLTGAPMDVRSDIYSLGATFYHLVTGVFPFTGKNALEIAKKHLEEPLKDPRLANREIPESIAHIIVKMMEKNPDARYQTAEALVEDLNLSKKGGKKARTVIFHTGQFKAPPPVQSMSTTSSHLNLGTSPMSTRTGTGKLNTESVRMAREKKAMRQVIVLIVSCTLVVGGAVGFVIWKSITNRNAEGKSKQEILEKKKIKKKDKEEPKKETPADIQKEPVQQEPQHTQYTEAAAKILDFAKNNTDARSDILSKCDSFFASDLLPQYKRDRDALDALLAIFVPLDEKYRLFEMRQALRNSHMAVIQSRIDEEKKQKEAGQQKLREQEREVELARIKKEKEEQLKRSVEEYSKSIDAKKDGLRYRAVVNMIDRGDYGLAEKVFAEAEKEPESAQSYMAEDARKFAQWGSEMKALVQKTKTFIDKISNISGESIGSIMIEVKPGAYGKVQKIKNNVLFVQTHSGKIESNNLFEIPPPQYKKLISKLSDDPQMPYLALLFTGAFNPLDQISEDKNLAQEGNAIIKAYIRGRYKYISDEMIGDEKEKGLKEFKAKFGRLKQFKEATDGSL